MKNQDIRIVLAFEYTLGEEGRKLESVDDCKEQALEEIADGMEMPEVEQDVRYDCKDINWEKLKNHKIEMEKMAIEARAYVLRLKKFNKERLPFLIAYTSP